MDRIDLRIPRGVAEEHPTGERVGFDVGKPGIKGGRHPLRCWRRAAEMLAPDPAQVGEMALEQLPVKRAL